MSHILQPKGAQGPAGPTDAAGGVQIRCPRCQMPFTAQVINIIDTRRAPQLKAALLAGYLNRAVCPSCGATAVLNVPLIYHDPDHELLLALLPTELNLSAEQQERLIGGLLQAIMSSVPAEERKGYFLRPQTILTMQRLVELILEADGITPEMVEAQNRRLRLLDDLLRAQDDAGRLVALMEEHRGELDYAFFATLVSAAEEASLAGDSQSAQQLVALRDRLLQEPDIAARLPQPLPPDSSLEAILDRLLAMLGDEQALAAMVALNRPSFDYLFFQGLTSQLERARAAGDNARAEQLAMLRSRVLEEVEAQNRALQAAQEQDLQLIDEILASADRDQAVREHLVEMDTLFLSTLTAAIQAARQQGNIERSARLDQLRRTIISLLAEAMPPELRLINRLLGLQSPEERQAVLAESASQLNDDLLQLVEGLAQELESQGREEALQRLRAIQAEIQHTREAHGAPGRPA